MDPISRRNLLAASAVGGLLTAANAAAAQRGPVPQPQRPGRGGTDPWAAIWRRVTEAVVRHGVPAA